MKRIFSLLFLLGSSFISGHTQGFSILGQTRIDLYSPEPVVVARGEKFLIHRLFASIGNREFPINPVIILTHTNTDSGKMNVLFASGIYGQPTRRITYKMHRIVGIAQDENRLYLAVWETGRVFTRNDSSPERGYKWSGRFYLIVFWKSDGTQIVNVPLHEKDPLTKMNNDFMFEAPDENVDVGPLKVISDGVTWEEKKFKFRGREFMAPPKPPNPGF
jgi:hypothetical protein